MLSAGQALRDRYQLQQKLGQNAGRQTWLATDTQASPPTDVVVKLLAFNPQMQWDDLKLFQREAQVLKNLNHPRIPKYLDYFSVDGVGASLEASSADNNSDQSNVTGLPWFGLVQDYIPGDSLKQLLEQGKPFSENQVRQFAEDLLKILINLHELSPPVLHRDIKPSNLILGKKNQIYLVDFGAVQDKAKAEGATFTVVGTSGYAPPEQLWGKAVPASDLYALGATLIHLLTGIPPAELPQQRMRIKFQDKVQINPNFAHWINQLIQPAPEKRLSTARQALSSLQSGFIDHPSKFSVQESISRLSDTDSGYGCGCLALLGLIGLGGLISLFLSNAAHQAKQSETKQYVGEMNRAQQAYVLEKNAFIENAFIERTQAIALNLTDAGEYTQALTVTRSIPHDSIRSNTIQAIAPYLTTVTEYEQGIQVAKTITDYEQKAKALDAMVRRLVAIGEHKRAVQITETIQLYYGGKDKAMAAIERYKPSP